MCKVSVLMPMYNVEKFINQSIQSILNQTFLDFEFLILDDGSTDQSYSIVSEIKDKRIQLFRNEQNYGAVYTRNKLLHLASGQYIAIMDADDIATENRLEMEVDYLDTHPDIDVVGGNIRIINEKNQVIASPNTLFINPNYIKAHLIFHNAIHNASSMFRKDFIIKYNIKYNSDYFVMHDYRFWCECARFGQLANIDEIFQLYRINSSGLSQTSIKKKEKEREELIDKIHLYNFETLGFHFSSEEEKLLLKIFRENGKPDSKEEIVTLYNTLRSLSKQAQYLKLENAEEINIMCRKQFGEKISKAFFLWEL